MANIETDSSSEHESDNLDYYERELSDITHRLKNLGFTSAHNTEEHDSVIQQTNMRRNNIPPRELDRLRGAEHHPIEVNVIQDDEQRQNVPPFLPARNPDAHVHELYTRASDALGDFLREPRNPRRFQGAARRLQDLEEAVTQLGWELQLEWNRRVEDLYTRLEHLNDRPDNPRLNRREENHEPDIGDPWAFNSHTSPGPNRYYEQFPHPWNVNLFEDDRGRRHDIHKSKVKIEVPIFGGKSGDDYYSWRACFIAHVHRSNQDVNSKLLSLMQCLAESVKQNLSTNSEFSPRGYHRVVTALERKYGGSKRLLTAALNAIRQHPPLRTDRIHDLERYIRDVQTLFDRLEEAELGEERLTQSTFKDLVRPLPFSYVTDFYKDLRTRRIEANSDELFTWAQNKLEEMQDAYEVKGPTEPRTDTQKETRKTYNHYASNDLKFIEGEDSDYPIDEDKEEWCHIVAQDKNSNCCPLCSSPKERSDHSLTDCPHFNKLPWNAKRVIFWQFRLCYNCGNRSHVAANCKAQKCQKCGESHHEVLHDPELKPTPSGSNNDKKKGTSLGVNGKEDKVSLLTLTVRVTNPETNDSVLVNCLLDSGSTLALMSTRLAEQLTFTGYKTPLALFGAGGKRADYFTVLGEVVVENPNGLDQEKVTVRVIDNPAGDHIVPHIANMRRDLDIADRAGDGKIDLILGCASPRLFLPLDTHKEAGGKRVFLKTPLGWGMMGELHNTQSCGT